MSKVFHYAEHLLWAIACLGVLLMVYWFVLNFVATKGPGPLASAAQTVEGLSSGSAYGI
jgi:hypothetical protein